MWTLVHSDWQQRPSTVDLRSERSGDVWVERSANYRRFDSYLLPPGEVPPIAAKLGLPTTADEWLATRGAELDRRLRRFSRRLRRGELIARGFREPLSPGAPYRPISWHEWRVMELKLPDRAEGGGIGYVGLTIGKPGTRRLFRRGR